MATPTFVSRRCMRMPRGTPRRGYHSNAAGGAGVALSAIRAAPSSLSRRRFVRRFRDPSG
jgi:hypothetical protein